MQTGSNFILAFRSVQMPFPKKGIIIFAESFISQRSAEGLLGLRGFPGWQNSTIWKLGYWFKLSSIKIE